MFGWFSVYKKPRCAMSIFHLYFRIAWDILAQRIYNAHAIFCQFSVVKDGGPSNNQASSVSWLPVNPNTLELAVLKKANLNLLMNKSSNATFSIVFFVCCVHKLNYIKNDFA